MFVDEQGNAKAHEIPSIKPKEKVEEGVAISNSYAKRRWCLVYYTERDTREVLDTSGKHWGIRRNDFVTRKEKDRNEYPLSSERDEEAIVEAREKLKTIPNLAPKRSFCSVNAYVHIKDVVGGSEYCLDLDTGDKIKAGEKDAKDGDIFIEDGRRFVKCLWSGI